MYELIYPQSQLLRDRVEIRARWFQTPPRTLWISRASLGRTLACNRKTSFPLGHLTSQVLISEVVSHRWGCGTLTRVRVVISAGPVIRTIDRYWWLMLWHIYLPAPPWNSRTRTPYTTDGSYLGAHSIVIPRYDKGTFVGSWQLRRCGVIRRPINAQMNCLPILTSSLGKRGL